jgi:heat shock protein HslJ
LEVIGDMTLRSATAVLTIMMLAGCTQSGGRSTNEGNDVQEDATTSTTVQAEPSDQSNPADDRFELSDYQGIRWEPLLRYTDGIRTKTYLTFHHNGTWTGLDGCNGQFGRYELSPQGDLTAQAEGQTLIECPGVNVNAALTVSDHVTVEGGRLTLYDGHKIVLELQRV